MKKRMKSIRRRPSFGLSASSRLASMEETAKAAQSHSNRFESTSSFFSTTREEAILRLRPEDVVRGSLVGKGAYNHVYEATLKVEELEEVSDASPGSQHKPSAKVGAANHSRMSRQGPRLASMHDELPMPPSAVSSISPSVPTTKDQPFLAVDGVAGESAASLPTVATEVMSSFNSPAGIERDTRFTGISETLEEDTVAQTTDKYISCPSEEDQPQRGRQRRYVLKCIRPSFLNDPERYKNGVIDLVLECKTLSSMTPHDNIIRLHGVSAGGVAENVSQGKFFLILERVQCTLSDRIAEWRMAQQPGIATILARSLHLSQPSGNANIDADTSGSSGDSGSEGDYLRSQRLRIASGLTAGLRHIHSHNIAYRDIKPENIGLDESGSVKIIDFGFAKEINPQDHNKSKRRPTGMVGTLRYMAPEVALCRHYDQRCDIYSLAIVLWELWSPKKPYSKMNRRQIQERVICGGERLKLNASWPDQIQDSIKQCWAEDPELRSTLESISDAILNAQRRKRRNKKSSSLMDFLSGSLHSSSKKGTRSSSKAA